MSYALCLVPGADGQLSVAGTVGARSGAREEKDT